MFIKTRAARVLLYRSEVAPPIQTCGLEVTQLEVGGFQSNQATSAKVMRIGADFAARRSEAQDGESSRNQKLEHKWSRGSILPVLYRYGYFGADVTR